LRTYNLYGLNLKSHWPLPCRKEEKAGSCDVELVEGPASEFLAARREADLSGSPGKWFHWAHLQDGTIYLRWAELFEFLIPADGRRVIGLPLAHSSLEAFSTYMLSQVLSFALLKQGVESLHATVVAIDGSAVAFLGDSGYGKSTIAAAFLQAGYRLITDDVLVLKRGSGGFCAYPGLCRIKLFPEIAGVLLGKTVNGVPMNPLTPKLIIPLTSDRDWEAPTPLRAIYVLSNPMRRPSPKGITIRRLSQRRAFLALLKNTFNCWADGPERLKRQFVHATQLAQEVPVKRLSYPREVKFLECARVAVLSDLPGSGRNGKTLGERNRGAVTATVAGRPPQELVSEPLKLL
jgi:hypothetical protein